MILITGASGNVGREVLKQVALTGAKVRAAYQDASRAAHAPAGVETITMDYYQPETVRAALKGADHVFLVGPPTAELPALERRAIDVIKHSDVEHVVKLSAMGGRAATFPRQHAESEDYIRSSGVPYTFLRPNGFMQNLVAFSAPSIKTQSAFYGSEGDGKVSQIDIRDVAAVAVKTLIDPGHMGRTYTLTGPEALNNAQIAELLTQALGREIRFVKLPPEQLNQAMRGNGVPEWTADAILDLQRLYREGKAATVTGDVEQILGCKPTSYADFVEDYKSAFQAREKVAS